MYLINIHDDFMTSKGELNFLKNIKTVKIQQSVIKNCLVLILHALTINTNVSRNVVFFFFFFFFFFFVVVVVVLFCLFFFLSFFFVFFCSFFFFKIAYLSLLDRKFQ